MAEVRRTVCWVSAMWMFGTCVGGSEPLDASTWADGACTNLGDATLGYDVVL